jgi:hypothetical protein
MYANTAVFSRICPVIQGGPDGDTTSLEGHDSHGYLLECLKGSGNLVTPEAVARAQNAPLRFRKTVQQLLTLTRVPCFG